MSCFCSFLVDCARCDPATKTKEIYYMLNFKWHSEFTASSWFSLTRHARKVSSCFGWADLVVLCKFWNKRRRITWNGRTKSPFTSLHVEVALTSLEAHLYTSCHTETSILRPMFDASNIFHCSTMFHPFCCDPVASIYAGTPAETFGRSFPVDIAHLAFTASDITRTSRVDGTPRGRVPGGGTGTKTTSQRRTGEKYQVSGGVAACFCLTLRGCGV